MKKITTVLAVFTLAATSIFGQNFWVKTFSSYDSYSVYENKDSVLFLFNGSVFKKSIDHGATWGASFKNYVSPGTKSTDYTYLIKVTPSSNSIIVFSNSRKATPQQNEYGFGVKVSEDGGDTFVRRNNGLGSDTNVTNVKIFPSGTMIIQTTKGAGISPNFYWSNDEGKNWQNITSSLIQGLTFEVINPNLAFLSQSLKKYYSTDEGRTWKETNINYDNYSFKTKYGETYSKLGYDKVSYQKSLSSGIDTITYTNNDFCGNGLGDLNSPDMAFIGKDSILYVSRLDAPCLITNGLKNSTKLASGMSDGVGSISNRFYHSRKGYLFTYNMLDGVYRSTKAYPKTDQNILASVSKKESKEFSIYPNPVQNQLSINTVWSNVHQINLLSMDGQIVLSKKAFDLDANSIDVSSINSGIYFIELVGDFGTSVQKVVVE